MDRPFGRHRGVGAVRAALGLLCLAVPGAVRLLRPVDDRADGAVRPRLRRRHLLRGARVLLPRGVAVQSHVVDLVLHADAAVHLVLRHVQLSRDAPFQHRGHVVAPPPRRRRGVLAPGAPAALRVHARAGARRHLRRPRRRRRRGWARLRRRFAGHATRRDAAPADARARAIVDACHNNRRRDDDACAASRRHDRAEWCIRRRER
mmetsp:Transcript_24221/g.74976  ORF Transcript_24221/g.74976 Transcript_24221/m.74976 type:complete len:205 (+) Transcript_24221:2085-2699(+)